jgi:predicted nucleotidyltransferase
MVLEKLLPRFEAQGIRYALIGGLALGLLGVGRATMDIDFLVLRDDMPVVDRLMTDLGYECRYRSENVSQYVSPLAVFGEVDFLHAFRESALAMLRRARKQEIFGGTLQIKVITPEDLIGLKLQALKNDPSGRALDLEDIKALVRIHGTDLDWVRIREYVRILEAEDWYALFAPNEER